MVKKGYNWKARQAVETKIDNSATQKVITRKYLFIVIQPETNIVQCYIYIDKSRTRRY